MMNLITGGWMAGYRTYVIGALFALQAIAAWALGDATLAQLIEQVPEILAGLGFMSMRKGIADSVQ